MTRRTSRKWLLCIVLGLALAQGPSLFAAEPTSVDPPKLEDVQTLIADGLYQEAEDAARSLLGEAELHAGAESLQVAEILDLLVDAMRRGGKAGETETFGFAERAIRIKVKVLGSEHPDTARSIKLLGILHHLSGDLQEAGRLYRQALAIQERSLGEDDLETVKTLNNLGVLHYRSGEYARARPLMERVLQSREKTLGTENRDVARILDNLGNLYREIGDYTESRRAFERALSIREKIQSPEHEEYGASLDSLANLLYTLGDYQSARPLYERGLKIRKGVLGPDHPDLALSHMNLANLLMDIGDRAAARTHYESALRIREKAFGRQSIEVALSLYSLGEWHRRSEEYAEARPLYQEALSISEAVLAADDPYVAYFVAGLAQLHYAQRDYATAVSLYRRERSITERAFGSDHPEVGRVLVKLARSLARSGEPSEALALALRAETIGRDHLRLTARALSEREALRYASVRAAALDLAISLVVVDGDPVSRRSLWDAVIRSRAMVLDEISARHRSVGRTDDPRIARLYEDLLVAREELARLMVRGREDDSPETFRQQLDAARGQAEEMERALAMKSSAFRRESERARIGLPEVVRALPPGSALVGFMRYVHQAVRAGSARSNATVDPEPEARYLAFVRRSGDAEPRIVPLGSVEEIEALVFDWKREASVGLFAPGRSGQEAEVAYRAAGEALRRLVWDPIEAHLKNTKQVFIVPDGALNLVNFVTLPIGKEDYLVETGPNIHYLSAERDLVTQPATGSPGKGVLAFGGPAFDETSIFAALRPARSDAASAQVARNAAAAGGDDRDFFRGEQSACGRFQSLTFKPLPATKLELEDIAALHEAAGIPIVKVTGAAASEAAFKQRAPGSRVLHLATHGFFMGESCGSMLDATRGIGGMKPIHRDEEPAVTGESPLLLSGLALAGANRRASAQPGEDDGILTAEEIAAMDLTGVEWAVLSACDTGVGEIEAGEGVFGLRRSFQIAGAETVIMSLWSVKDEPAREWMRGLYGGRLAGLSTAEAVQHASLEMIESRRTAGTSTHPFYWGAFFAVGDWR